MTPADVGAPARFQEWRNGQDRAFEMLLNSQKRIAVVAAPTGVGKSLVGMAYGELSGERYVYLTSTRGLQDQISAEFAETGIYDIRGAANYACDELDGYGCDAGIGVCGFRTPGVGGCPYLEAIAAAVRSKAVLTNYAFWLVAPSRLGERKLLVLDEGHDAADHLLGALRLTLWDSDIDLRTSSALTEMYAAIDNGSWAAWVQWLGVIEAILDVRLKGTRRPETQKRLRELLARIARVLASKEPWVVTRTSRSIVFEPVWATPYVEPMLFQDIPKIVIMSATIKPKTLEYLGLRRSEYDYITVPSPFPTGRRPTYVVMGHQGEQTPKMSSRTDIAELRTWVRLIDTILEHRGDRKGIVHTVSYDRAEFLEQYSQHSARMLLHDAKSTKDVVEKFKSSPRDSGLVLVSPSVHTGYDFPYDEAEFQVIAKVPFPDPNDPIVKARSTADPDYAFHAATARIVQASGRGMRAPDDACETFIVDLHATWLLAKYKAFMPVWFNDSVRRVDRIPAPPVLRRTHSDP